jgi:adenine deaminase
LFDPTKDPHELMNVAEDPANAATIAEMKSLLAKTFVNMPSRIADTTRPPVKRAPPK